MRSTTRVILLGTVMVVLGGLATATENLADPFPGNTTSRVASAVLLGLGASLLASGLAARLIANQVAGLDFSEAIEALRGTSPLTRSDQFLEITLRATEREVSLKAEHRFDLTSSFMRKRVLPFRMYTDAARWGSEGGFSCVVEPDGTALRDEELAQYVKDVEGKPQFEKLYTFRPGVTESVIIETYASFRLTDRLIWTIEHISRDLRVRINDYTGLVGDLGVKVNHHRAREVAETVRRRKARDGQIIEFVVVGAVLPYQGFELQWHYDDAEV